MNSIEAQVLPTLFVVLLGFILTNLILNLCLFSFTKIKSLKLLVLYWGSLFLFTLLMGSFQDSPLLTVLSFSASIVPMCVLAKLLLQPVGVKPPFRIYASLWALGVSLSLVSSGIVSSFFGLAIPVSLTLGMVLLHIAYCLSFDGGRPATRLQHFISFLLFVSFVHTLNFAIFRGREGNQIWGWSMAFTTYQVLSLSVLALIFERHTQGETERLETIVGDRTMALSKALSVKEKLIRIVLHDIAGPIQGQSLILSRIKSKKDPEVTETLLPKLTVLTEIVRSVIQKVFTMESIDAGSFKFQRSPVNLDDCLRELQVVFEPRLTEKNLTLEIENALSPSSTFLADHVIFTTSVLGNLLSNAIKYSLPGKKIILKAIETDAHVFIDVIDQGIGIPRDLMENLSSLALRSSRPGTLGEPGTGFGLSQAEAYLHQFGGKMRIESRAIEGHPFDHGTVVHLELEKSGDQPVINTKIAGPQQIM